MAIRLHQLGVSIPSPEEKMKNARDAQGAISEKRREELEAAKNANVPNPERARTLAEIAIQQAAFAERARAVGLPATATAREVDIEEKIRRTQR